MTNTIRLDILPGATERIIIDDGRYTSGQRVDSLVVIGSNNGANPAEVVMHYNPTAPANIDLSDGQQIGWGLWNTDTTNGERLFTAIDPNHIITQDLFITALTGGCGVMITTRTVSLSEAEGVLQLVKAKRQGE